MGAVTGEALECGDAGVLFGEEGIAGLRSGGGFGRREQVGEDVGQRDLGSGDEVDDCLQAGVFGAAGENAGDRADGDAGAIRPRGEGEAGPFALRH